MPTYEYECTKCNHAFEAFQSITAEPLKRCPKCRSKVKRLLGKGAGIIFKGTGFYETDYRRKTGSGSGSSSSSSSSDASTKSTTESKSTPSAKE